MKFEINRLRDMIKAAYPYRAYKTLKKIFAGIAIALFSMMIIFCFIDSEPVPYDETSDFQYAYLNIKYISPMNYRGYYLIQDNNNSLYIYHQEEPFTNELHNLQMGRSDHAKVYGTPDSQVDDEILEGLIPIFNLVYEDHITEVKELVAYTGYGYLDQDISNNSLIIGLSAVFSALFMFFYLLVVVVQKIWEKRFKSVLQGICYRGEDTEVIVQLSQPIQLLPSLNIALLPDYLVSNHPSPFVIAYDDIVMIYEVHVLRKEISLFLYDRDLKKHKILFASALIPNNFDELEELLRIIKVRYPKVLIGDTSQNREMLKQMKSYME